jgi:hypothetical protein
MKREVLWNERILGGVWIFAIKSTRFSWYQSINARVAIPQNAR